MKLVFPHPEEFLRKLSTIWARTFKLFAIPVLDRKNFKEYRFEEAPKLLACRISNMSRASPERSHV
jgi:hypothetical protein